MPLVTKKEISQAINSKTDDAWRDLVIYAADAILQDNNPELAKVLIHAADIKQRDLLCDIAKKFFIEWCKAEGIDPAKFGLS